MTQKIDVVIGANFGDEGKGLVTDYLTSGIHPSLNTAVVRFNGGAQAGHTVELADGTRHVFSHVGSGTFNGSDTILSHFFVLNPKLFMNEVHELSEKVTNPIKVSGYKGSPITTPYEVVLNRLTEIKRAANRGGIHGSVGVGFGDTIARDEAGVVFTPTHCTIQDLRNVEKWFWEQVNDRKLEIDSKSAQMISSESIDEYRESLGFMIENMSWYSTYGQILPRYDHLVFEGAQGLLLDMDYGEFPHVTRSNTGLKNVIDIVGKVDMTVHYVSRTYLTRHGAGPLENEIFEHNIVDETNQPNPWQGKLRVAPLDYASMMARCVNDIRTHHPGVKAFIVMTWVDSSYNKADLKDGPTNFINFYGKTRDQVVANWSIL